MARAPRDEILDIQRGLVRRLAREIRGAVVGESPEIRRYLADYRRSTRRFRSLSSRDELMDAVAASDLVFVGDYHTLRESQYTIVRLLDEIAARPAFWRRKKAIVLALEMILAEHQPILDRFLAGEIDEPTFLRAVGYQRTWGFNWTHYKVLLDFARSNGIYVIGLNSRPPRGPNRLARRDAAAARILAYVARRIPDALVMVLFGDLHVAENRLPRAVACELAGDVPRRRCLTVYQNVEPIYWELARRGRENSVDVVRIRAQAFAVFNASPFAAFRSYVDWQDRHRELACDLHPWWCDTGGPEVDLTDQVVDLARTIAAFLRLPLPPEEFARLSVRTTHEPDFLARLLRHVLDPTERAELEVTLRRNEAYFVPRIDTIVLADFSVNHAADLAAQFLHARLSGAPGDAATRPIDAFYAAVLRSALGYFGSKVVNPKRMCRKDPDYRRFLEEHRRRALSLEWQREFRRVARHVLAHRELERDFLKGGRWRPRRNLHRLAVGVRLGLAHSLGYTLGDRLYDGLVLEHVSKEEIRELFLRPFARPGDALQEYLYLLRRLHHVQETYAERRERM
ncbi:MAG: ChaN family lipoprotein [Planctomycetes bacterium]|nr:ChaN family lipoprotein [Planctomycetota bacterium]